MTSSITGHTGLICLLGSPCSHSISPMMHNAAFEALHLDYCYLAFDVDEDVFPDGAAIYAKFAIDCLKEMEKQKK